MHGSSCRRKPQGATTHGDALLMSVIFVTQHPKNSLVWNFCIEINTKNGAAPRRNL
jgi:hypothetical protein